MPAGTDGELGFDLGCVQRVILRDQEGLKGGSVHKQRHGGELHIQHIVVPLFVAHLPHTQGEAVKVAGRRDEHEHEHAWMFGIRNGLAPDLVQLPVELGGFVVLGFCRLLAEEEDEPAVVHVEGVVVPVHVCGGKTKRDGVGSAAYDQQNVNKLFFCFFEIPKSLDTRASRLLGSRSDVIPCYISGRTAADELRRTARSVDFTLNEIKQCLTTCYAP